MPRICLLLCVIVTAFSSYTAHGGDNLSLASIADDLAKSNGLNSAPLLSLPLQQGWREEPEEDLAPGLARIYAGEAGFDVIAVFEDEHIENTADGFNQKTWQTGDVFELFIQAATDRYYEVHVTPENQNLFLRWSPATFAAVKKGEYSFQDALITDRDFATSRTQVFPKEGYWTVFLHLPYASLELEKSELDDAPIKVAFTRYDVTPGREKAVLSATPAFPRASFHIIDAWHPLPSVGQTCQCDQ